ncbi:hypothetical protein GF325_18270 [Candidatus Bathyarchaeota archaeon]|nr:hypothetical protein [Candidatus Bathyarchaeota archaeon]
MSKFKAGFQEIDITPPIGTTALAGYGGLKKFAQGINDPLKASCIVLELQETRLAIVSLDLVGLLPETVGKIRDLAFDLSDGLVQRQNIMIACTHTHSGPDTMGIFTPGHFLQYKPDIGYLEMLVRKVAGSILGALNNLEPVTASYATGSLIGASANRRAHLSPNPLHERTIDPEVQALYFHSDQGLKGIIVNFAAHGTSFPTGSTMHISADFVHGLRDELKAHYNQAVTCVYLNGAIGDVTPLSLAIPKEIEPVSITLDKENNEGIIGGFKEFCNVLHVDASRFASFVEEIVENPTSKLHGVSILTSLDAQGNLILKFAEKFPSSRNIKRLLMLFIYNEQEDPAHVRVGKKIAQKVIKLQESRRRQLDVTCLISKEAIVTLDIDDPEMANEGIFEDYIIERDGEFFSEVIVQAFQVGPAIILTIPGEAVTEMQLRLKTLIRQQAGDIPVLISGVSNGEIGYILTPEEFDLAGYESMICFGRENAHIIERKLLELVSSLEGISPVRWSCEIDLPANSETKLPRLKELLIIQDKK